MKDNQDKIEYRVSKDLVKRMLDHLKSIFDKYMMKFPKYEELITIMDDEKNIYDVDGKPSVEYSKLINQFDKFCTQNPIDIEEIANEDNFDDNKIEVLKGAKGFLDNQKELMKSYRRSSDKAKWASQILDSKEKRDAFEEILEKSASSIINDIETTISKEGKEWTI